MKSFNDAAEGEGDVVLGRVMLVVDLGHAELSVPTGAGWTQTCDRFDQF